MSDTARPIPTRRGILTTLCLLTLVAMTSIDASAGGQVTSTLVAPNPPPDLGSVAYDPNDAANMGISPDQYSYCQIGSPLPYTQVAGCPNPTGTQHECQAYCHVIDGTPLTFDSNPPNSGNHWPEPFRTIGESTQVVERGHWVHSMEHGAVLLLYNCSTDCSADLQTFRAALTVLANKCLPVIIMPDPQLKNRFAMASWTWTMAADQMFDAATVNCFIQQHAAHGRECPASDPNGKNFCPAFVFTDPTCPANINTAK